ncbi:MAG: hypothetical protein L6R41_006028 [Letrouitia leprolyta]|nr:MAG: hypothetical protein L6R41_006028 [Letrouitia leprolyta]
MRFLTLATAAALLIASIASALGINCKGNFWCRFDVNATRRLHDYVSTEVQGNKEYGDHEELACTRDINCGSVPLDPGIDVHKGELTVTYRSNHYAPGPPLRDPVEWGWQRVAIDGNNPRGGLDDV